MLKYSNYEYNQQLPLKQDDFEAILTHLINQQVALAKEIVDCPPNSLQELKELAQLQYQLNQDTLNTTNILFQLSR